MNFPETIGHVKRLPATDYPTYHQVLISFLPRSRRILSTLELAMNARVERVFYVPKSDDPPSRISAMIISLSEEEPEPFTAFTYFSKLEDVEKVCNC